MGRERSRKMEYFFLYVTCSVMMLTSISGCSLYAHQLQARACLSSAAASVAQGDFMRALQKNNQALKQYPGILADQRLYQRGLIYMHPRNPERNEEKAIENFTELRKSYPNSQFGASAEVWIITLEASAQKEKATRQLAKKNQALIVKKYQALEAENKKLSDALNDEVSRNQRQTTQLKEQIKQLESQLDRLKKIDLGIEKKKRQGAPE